MTEASLLNTFEKEMGYGERRCKGGRKGRNKYFFEEIMSEG